MSHFDRERIYQTAVKQLAEDHKPARKRLTEMTSVELDAEIDHLYAELDAVKGK